MDLLHSRNWEETTFNAFKKDEVCVAICLALRCHSIVLHRKFVVYIFDFRRIMAFFIIPICLIVAGVARLLRSAVPIAHVKSDLWLCLLNHVETMNLEKQTSLPPMCILIQQSAFIYVNILAKWLPQRVGIIEGVESFLWMHGGGNPTVKDEYLCIEKFPVMHIFVRYVYSEKTIYDRTLTVFRYKQCNRVEEMMPHQCV